MEKGVYNCEWNSFFTAAMQMQNNLWLVQGLVAILGLVGILCFLQLYHPHSNLCHTESLSNNDRPNNGGFDQNFTRTSSLHKQIKFATAGSSNEVLKLEEEHTPQQWELCIHEYRLPYKNKTDSEVPTNIRNGTSYKASQRFPMSNFPKVIWMFWDKGWRNAPSMQYKCMLSWRYYNQDFKVIALDLQQAECLISRKEYYSDEAWKSASIQAKSDIIRLELLAR